MSKYEDCDNKRKDVLKNKNKRIGEVNYNKCGNEMVIIEYRNANDINVLFPKYNYIKLNNKYSHFKNGGIRCPYDKTVFNIGYIGEGRFKVSVDGVLEKSYVVWSSMLNRCYHSKHVGKMAAYKDVIVCEEWHCYQTFCEWFEKNYYEIFEENIRLDKDILVKGNKVYSPETCVFVPEKINNLFIKSDIKRGKCPIGVTYHKQNKKYASSVNSLNNKQGGYIGLFNTAEEVFYSYKDAKEKYIKQIAEEYKDRIPQKLYDALVAYEVEITD